MTTTQLPLGVTLHDSATFANYVPGINQVIYQTLQQLIVSQEQNYLYLCGTTGTGKTHLLQAVCQQIGQQGKTPIYLPLRYFYQVEVSILEGVETRDCVCIDDIQAIVGLPQWEEALFHLFNRLKDNQTLQIISGDVPPQELGLQLPDLISRLAWGGIFALQSLDDDSKIQALQIHAARRGLILSDEVALYLTRHCTRDMHNLMKWLERIDYASLAAQRKITIPFIRTLLIEFSELVDNK